MVDEEASFYYVNPHDASSFPLKTFLKNKVLSTVFKQNIFFSSFRSDTFCFNEL